MRVLWLCNIMLPVIAKHLNRETIVKEGWITGLFEQVLYDAERTGVELSVCFPADKEMQGYNEKITTDIKGKTCSFKAYAFCEDTAHPDKYDTGMESELGTIFEDFKPDVIHCFGTEYPHTLAALKVFTNPEKVLLGLQGICFKLADAYKADLPDKIYKRFLFRDLIKRDNIRLQQEKFYRRGQMEKEALLLARNVTGRTKWDKRAVMEVNPRLNYYFMSETLRPGFYTGQWEYKKCKPHTIFLSQGDYPIKGLHYMLMAMPKILEKYPDAHINVAGQSIIRYNTLKEKLKISSYGKYLLEQIKKYGLEEKITFLGRLNAEEMKEQYLAANLFVCPSALENSPNSLGEAMLLGMPCVAADVGGIPSLFTKSEGILFEGGNPDALADAVTGMWENERRMVEYAHNARARALCNHDADCNYHTLLQIYGRICKN